MREIQQWPKSIPRRIVANRLFVHISIFPALTFILPLQLREVAAAPAAAPAAGTIPQLLPHDSHNRRLPPPATPPPAAPAAEETEASA